VFFVYCVLFNESFIDRTKDLKLTLTESGIENIEGNEDQSWGEIFLTVTLVPKTQEEKEQVRCHYFRLYPYIITL
jgi:hypothetical protein